MEFIHALDGLNRLQQEGSTNGKKLILRDLMKKELFRKVLLFALDPKLTFGFKQLPKFKKDLFNTPVSMDSEEVFEFLTACSKQPGVSAAQKMQLASGIFEEAGATEVVGRILKKDLRCGVKTSLVNSVEPGFIQLWPYMRCKSHSEKNLEAITYPAIAQLKADGTHIDIKMENGDIGFFSRIGNEYDFLGHLVKEATDLFDVGAIALEDRIEGVFIGEGTVLNEDGTTMDRQTGNGIINKALTGSITEEEASRIRISLWEFVELEEFLAGKGEDLYLQALEFVIDQTDGNPKIQPIEFQFVNNYGEVLAFYRDVKARKLEGLIVKNLTGKFKSTNSGTKDQVKVKAVLGEEFEAEFRIIGINPGKEGTRFEHGIGSLQYESECGLICGNVGSGLSHEQRDTLIEDDLLETIATIRFDEVVKDKREGSSWSLYAPRVIELFREKTEADTLEYVRELIGGK